MKITQEQADYSNYSESVDRPLPFHVWLRKRRILDAYLAVDPDGHRRDLDAPIRRLCDELAV